MENKASSNGPELGDLEAGAGPRALHLKDFLEELKQTIKDKDSRISVLEQRYSAEVPYLHEDILKLRRYCDQVSVMEWMLQEKDCRISSIERDQRQYSDQVSHLQEKINILEGDKFEQAQEIKHLLQVVAELNVSKSEMEVEMERIRQEKAQEQYYDYVFNLHEKIQVLEADNFQQGLEIMQLSQAMDELNIRKMQVLEGDSLQQAQEIKRLSQAIEELNMSKSQMEVELQNMREAMRVPWASTTALISAMFYLELS